MRTIPYGYEMKNGRYQVVPEEAEALTTAFRSYLRGDSLRNISNDTGIGKTHSGIARLLIDRRYLGTTEFPQIVDQDLFDRVQAVREKRLQEHQRPERVRVPFEAKTQFTMLPATDEFTDPVLEAQYRYSLIRAKE